jgi:hypothetical protein
VKGKNVGLMARAGFGMGTFAGDDGIVDIGNFARLDFTNEVGDALQDACGLMDVNALRLRGRKAISIWPRCLGLLSWAEIKGHKIMESRQFNSRLTKTGCRKSHEFSRLGCGWPSTRLARSQIFLQVASASSGQVLRYISYFR